MWKVAVHSDIGFCAYSNVRGQKSAVLPAEFVSRCSSGRILPRHQLLPCCISALSCRSREARVAVAPPSLLLICVGSGDHTVAVVVCVTPHVTAAVCNLRAGAHAGAALPVRGRLRGRGVRGRPRRRRRAPHPDPRRGDGRCEPDSDPKPNPNPDLTPNPDLNSSLNPNPNIPPPPPTPPPDPRRGDGRCEPYPDWSPTLIASLGTASVPELHLSLSLCKPGFVIG